MRFLLVFALALGSLPLAAQIERPGSARDQSIPGARFVIHWDNSIDVELADAARVLAVLETVRLAAEERAYPALVSSESFLVDVFIEDTLVRASAGFHEEEPQMPFLVISPELLTLEEEGEQEGELAAAYFDAMRAGAIGDCLEDEPRWSRAAKGHLTFAVAENTALVLQLLLEHREDAGRFGGAGNLMMYLLWLDGSHEVNLVGPAVAECLGAEQADPLLQYLERRAETLENGDAGFGRFFIDLLVEQRGIPAELAAFTVNETSFPLEEVFAFDGRSDELGPIGFAAWELVDEGEFRFFSGNTTTSYFMLTLREGAWESRLLENNEDFTTGERTVFVVINLLEQTSFVDFFIEGTDGFDDCFDECDCFGECGGLPGPVFCAGDTVPRTTPWGLLALLLLATGTARAGARRRRGNESGADARRSR